MNKKNADYKTYSADLVNKEDLIKGEITEAFSQYTMEEASENPQAVKDEILSRIQALYGSDFIFDVTLSNPLYQKYAGHCVKKEGGEDRWARYYRKVKLIICSHS